MYQTIGIVRYSGCSGSATLYCASLYTGDVRCRASIQSSGCRPASRGRDAPRGRRVEQQVELGVQQVVLVLGRRSGRHRSAS
jgi:hypothetical protein